MTDRRQGPDCGGTGDRTGPGTDRPGRGDLRGESPARQTVVPLFSDGFVSSTGPADDDGVRSVALVGGVAYLAVRADADGDGAGIGVASTEAVARRRAVDAGLARRATRSTKPSGHATSGSALTLDDFVPGGMLDGGPLVRGRGLLSGDAYDVPLGVVTVPGSVGSLVCSQPSTLGTTWVSAAAVASGASSVRGVLEEATAHVVGQDIVSRWWHAPESREAPGVVPAERLPPRYREIASAVAERGLVSTSHVFTIGRPVVLTILSCPDGTECTFGVATGDPASSAEESLCDALHARLALQWPEYPSVDPLEYARILTGWKVGGAKVRLLERSGARASPPWTDADDRDARPWSELALARFDHEPVVVTWPPSDDGAYAVRVLCPGAEVYHRADTMVPFPAW